MTPVQSPNILHNNRPCDKDRPEDDGVCKPATGLRFELRSETQLSAVYIGETRASFQFCCSKFVVRNEREENAVAHVVLAVGIPLSRVAMPLQDWCFWSALDSEGCMMHAAYAACAAGKFIRVSFSMHRGGRPSPRYLSRYLRCGLGHAT